MPRRLRFAAVGFVYYVLNRACVGHGCTLSRAFQVIPDSRKPFSACVPVCGTQSATCRARRARGGMALVQRRPLPVCMRLSPLGPWRDRRNWAALIDPPENEKELESRRRSIRRGRPYGSDAWTERTGADSAASRTVSE